MHRVQRGAVINKDRKKKESSVSRKEIADRIYRKLDKSIKKKYITSAISIICEELIDSLLHKESITVKNFGTLNPYIFHKHEGFNVNTGDIQEYPEFWSVKFHSHIALELILEERKERFGFKSS